MVSKLCFKLMILMFFIAACNAAPLTDDDFTFGLWHMDTIVGSVVEDDDSLYPNRNHHLTLVNGPILTTGGGVYGEALSFDGVDDTATIDWPGAGSFKIDAWINPANLDANSTEYLVYMYRRIFLRYDNNDIYFYARNAANDNYGEAKIEELTGNQWLHVIASVDFLGNMTLDVDGTIATGVTPGGGFAPGSGVIWLGSTSNSPSLPYFEGLMDDVKISTVPDPLVSVSLLHMDQTATGYDRGVAKTIVPDDDAGSDNDLFFGYWKEDANDDGGLLASPILTADGGGYTGNAGDKALQFDGLQGAFIPESYPGDIPPQAIEVEFYIKPASISSGVEMTLISGNYAWEIRLDPNDATGTDARLWFIVWDNDETVRSAYSPYIIQTGNWYHVKANASLYAMQVWVDGQSMGSTANTNGVGYGITNPGYKNIVVGCKGDFNGRFYNGLLDELQISVFDMCGVLGYFELDLNQDCYVNFGDFAIMAASWLDCTDPGNPDCTDY